jgi:hypothetical protein
MRTAPFVDQAAYLEGLAWKRKLHKQHNTRLEELYSYQLSEGTLEENILDLLNRVAEPQIYVIQTRFWMSLKALVHRRGKALSICCSVFLTFSRKGNFRFQISWRHLNV